MSNIIIPDKHRSFTKPRPKTKSKATIGDGLPRTAVFNEDVKHIKVSFGREGMGSLTKDCGVKGLMDVLRALQFDLNMPYERLEDHPKEGMTTFFQYQEW